MIPEFICVVGAAGLVLIVAGCRSPKTAHPVSGGPSDTAGAAPGFVDPSESESTTGLPTKDRADSMLAWSAGNDIQVADMRHAIAMALSITEKIGGVVEMHAENAPSGASLKLHVPADSLARFLEAIEAIGNVASKRVENKNVAAEHSKIHARLQDGRIQRERLHGLLDQAGDVEDILAIEITLDRVQREIDSMETQARSLQRQIDYAAMELTFRLEQSETTTIYGPLGLLFRGISWTGRKLFVIRDDGQPYEAKGLAYTVQPGDTLEGIGRLFTVTAKAIKQNNPSLRFKRVIPGQTILIPDSEPG
jgi:hypothetical protein